MSLAAQNRRFDWNSLLITLLCLGGAASGAYCLYQDINASGAKGLGKPMARIERREAQVKRKPGNSYLWSNTLEQEELYKKDSIQTGPGAAVAIRMEDGTQLELGEDSLVVIDTIENIALNFSRGQIVVRGTQGDRKITVDKDGKAKVEELPLSLSKPDPLAQFFVPEGQGKEIRFEWAQKSAAGASAPDKLVVQVSPEKSFKSRGTQAFAASGAQARDLTAKLGAGRYFWRVVDGKGVPLTQSASFRVIGAMALRPVSPNASEKVVNWGDDSNVQFRWASPTLDESILSGVSHRIEVASDAEFGNVVAGDAVSGDAGSATLKGVPPGTLYWRVRSQYPGLAVTSGSQKFVVEKATRLTVNLGKPDEAQTFEFRPQYRFNWSCDSTEVEYQMELQRAGKTVASGKGSATAFTWKDPEPGTYRWHVVALSKGKNVGESPWRTFSIFKGKPLALKEPASNREILYWDEPAKFAFEWEKQELADQEDISYQLELSTDREFRGKVIAQKTKDATLPSKKLNLPPGTYYWRIKLVDANGVSLKTSEALKFTYGIHPTLRAPASVEPEPGKIFDAIEKDVTPVAKWTPVEGAEAYEVTVKLGSKVVLQTVTEKSSIELKGLTEGKYVWSIRSIDQLKRKGDPSEIKGFQITYGEPLGAPEAVSPEVQ